MLRRCCGLAIGRLLTRRGGDLGQHWSLQLHAGPNLGHVRRWWQLWRRRRCRRLWRFRRLRGTGYLCPRHLCPRQRWLGQRWFGGRRHGGQSVALALDFVSLDHRLAQVLDLHGRGMCCGGRPRRRTRRRSRGPRWSHRDNARFFLSVIEHDGVLRDGIGDDAGRGCVDARFTVTRTPHARGRLGWRSAPGGLRLGGALGARRRRRRQCWRSLAHSGHKFSTPRNRVYERFERCVMLLTVHAFAPNMPAKRALV